MPGRALHFFIVQWMDEAQLSASGAGEDPGGLALAELGAPRAHLAATLGLHKIATVGSRGQSLFGHCATAARRSSPRMVDDQGITARRIG